MLLPMNKKFNLVHVFYKFDPPRSKMAPNGSLYWNLAYGAARVARFSGLVFAFLIFQFYPQKTLFTT